MANGLHKWPLHRAFKEHGLAMSATWIPVYQLWKQNISAVCGIFKNVWLLFMCCVVTVHQMQLLKLNAFWSISSLIYIHIDIFTCTHCFWKQWHTQSANQYCSSAILSRKLISSSNIHYSTDAKSFWFLRKLLNFIFFSLFLARKWNLLDFPF